MEVRKIYEELNELLCNQNDALKDLVWTIAQNRKLSRPRNVLLVGELGSGKSTMVELTAQKMKMPIVSISGLCTSNGFEPKALFNAFSRLFVENDREDCHGIVLIEDMRDCFIYGGFSDLSSLITSGTFCFNNSIFDISKTMFVGEIDNNELEDCFIPKPVYTLENLDEAFLPENCDRDEIKRIIEDLVTFGNELDCAPDIYSDIFRDALRNTFLSIECSKAFSKKIFMENMRMEDIRSALTSPISELQIYKDDLCEEYITSPHFINSVAGHIRESMVGLHDLDEAVQEVARFDNNRKIKVYKENSLMRL